MALMVRCPKCGETKEHPETILGQVLQCSSCDQRFLVVKVPARGNYAIVKPILGSGKASLPPELRGPPTCITAALSLILGLAGFVTFGLCGLAGLVLGILGFRELLSLILGLVGFATFGLGGLAGLVLGILGLRKTAGGAMRGRGLAVDGMAVGALSIVAWAVVFVAGGAIWDAFTKPDAVTRQTFVALDAALDRYHDDWGKFPWIDTTPDGLMGAVNDDPKKGVRPMKGKPDDAEALLYAALNMRQKHGPYVTGRALMSKEKEANGVRYRVYCDGWSHPIHYDVPESGKRKPLLESGGENPDDTSGHLTNE